MTKEDQVYLAELNRADSKNIPVNLIYPSDYPNSPAIMLPEVLSPTRVLDVLKRFTPEPEEYRRLDSPRHQQDARSH